MTEEKDQYEGFEDEEYHFSDDQMNYETEPAALPITDTKSSPRSFMTSLNEAMIKYKKPLLFTGFFVVAIWVTYKMMVPSVTTSKTDDFTTGAASTTSQAMGAAQPRMNVQPRIVPVAVVKAPISVPNNGSNTEEKPIETVTQTTTSSSLPVSSVPLSPASVQPFDPLNSIARTTEPSSNNKLIMDRLSALEQQNAAVMNLLQTEFAQKMADYNTENTSLRGKVGELSRRLNSLETSISKLDQLLQDGPKHEEVSVQKNTPPLSPKADSNAAKLIYTVQAIIPGRAWLKAESGDTVTVAEGDLLKDYGRITKIDPYDGVVDIDTGTKIISLSYGGGAE